jgi:hypothetical protein
MLVQGAGDEVKIAFLKKMPKEKLQQVVFVCIVTIGGCRGSRGVLRAEELDRR